MSETKKRNVHLDTLTTVTKSLHALGAYVSLDIDPDRASWSLYATTKEKTSREEEL